ncbi:acetolactate synthase 2 catalytic subunit [Endozoicomonas numazuensis]|uniref:Acetolactate synthase n=1 Tax=Endozoicomonas numazuensis TaxID=1137799 RepID=A0A081NLV5_9GAMM|nr:acetolactate synthase 2 catalytic subunit [Endozoicomonas numazuensis]KEQ19428.1 acetolactate synthase catalytic subunit [Endozoicomonas numazuensis]
MNGANALVKNLSQRGIQHVFGYPGGTIMPVYDALLGSNVEHLLCRHEQGAAFAAIGYARASGKTGVCIATSGPGATNLITALSDAMLDSIPLVAITGQVPTAMMGTDAFQEIDILGMTLSCTKHSFLVTDPNDICETLNKAFALAQSGRPGPVLVDLPKDVQQAEAHYAPPLDVIEERASDSFDKINQAITLLQKSSQPVAYIGGGVGMANAVGELRAFLAGTGIPSVCTLKGIGAVRPDDHAYLGMLGMHGTRAANLAVQECDLLVAIGARFDDRVTGKLERFAPNAKVVHLDIDPAEFGKRRLADVSLSGCLKKNLNSLTIALEKNHWLQHCKTSRASSQWCYDKPGEDIFAPLLLKQLSEATSENTVISCDVGQHQMWVAQHMSFYHPSNHLSSAGLGTMGFGLPAAIGAAISRPEDDVILVSGDGSFMMNVQELASIKRKQLPVKIVLLDNQRLGMVKQWQELFFDQRYSETDLSDNPDFVTLAKAFGIEGRMITKRQEVLPALNEMLQTPGARILHVCIDERENVWPLVPPGSANHEMMEASA